MTDKPEPKPYKSFLDMTNGEVLVMGAPRVNMGLMLGYQIRLTAKALPNTPRREGVYKYTARAYKGGKLVFETSDTNFYHLMGVMLAGEIEQRIEKERKAEDA